MSRLRSIQDEQVFEEGHDAMGNAPTIRVGVLGLGTVGSSLVRLIAQQGQAIETRTGIRLEVTRAAVRNLDAPRGLASATPRIVDDPMSVVEADDVDLVVELMGGVEPARQLIERAIRLRKPVVSANKELIASCSRELFELADAAGVDATLPDVEPDVADALVTPPDRAAGARAVRPATCADDGAATRPKAGRIRPGRPRACGSDQLLPAIASATRSAAGSCCFFWSLSRRRRPSGSAWCSPGSSPRARYC